MYKVLAAFMLVGAMLFSWSARAEEEKKSEAPAEKKSEAPADKKAEPPAEQTLKGKLAPATNNTGLATLKVDAEDKAAPPKVLALFAEGDVEKEVKELLKTRAHVEVTGTPSQDGLNLKVAKITEIKDPKAPPKKGGSGARKTTKL